MKHLIRQSILLVALLAFLGGSTTFAQTRIAGVDLKKVYEGYWKTKQANKIIQDRAEELNKELKDLGEKHGKLKDEWQQLVADANDQTLSAEERDRRKKAGDTKVKELQELEKTIVQYQQDARDRLSKQSTRMRENLLDEIEKVVAVKAQNGNYSLVLDSSARVNDWPTVLYSNLGEADLTTEVLSQLNVGAPLETEATSAKPDLKSDTNKKE